MIKFISQNRKTICSFNIVHGHLSFGIMFSLLIKILCGRHVKVISTIHSTGMIGRIQDFALAFASLLLLNGTCLVANSDRVNWIPSRLSQKIRIIENGINFKNATPAFYYSSDYDYSALKLGTICRLHPDRNPVRYIDLIIHLNRLLDKSKKIKLVVIGDGPLKKEMVEIIHMRNLQNEIIILDSKSDKSAFFSSIDIYVSINVGVIVGIAGLEAIAHHVPVVSFQNRKTHDGSLDWVPSSNSPESLAPQILALLLDSNKLKYIQVSQWEYAKERFSSDTMTQKYIDLYLELGAGNVR